LAEAALLEDVHRLLKTFLQLGLLKQSASTGSLGMKLWYSRKERGYLD
jgi:DNA-binding IclR family transcriptional regulator